jgi:tetratricopeptide (TPR) repeat protein
VRGRATEAAGHLRELAAQALATGEPAAAVAIAAEAARLRLRAGDAGGVAELEALLAAHPLDAVDALSRPYPTLALLAAEAGDAPRARRWLAAYERAVPPAWRGPDAWLLHRARAAAHAADGRPTAAIAELRRAADAAPLRVGRFDDRALRVTDHPALARVYEAAGLPDSAVAVYERYLAVASLARTLPDALELGPALERLAALEARRGAPARAAEHRRQLAALWRGGDAPFRARAAAAP